MSKQQSTLDKWLALKNKKKQVAPIGIAPMPVDLDAPLSHGQERLWLLQELYPNNQFYNYAHLYDFKGQLALDLLLESWQKVIQRHQVLQTVFQAKGEQIVQVHQPAQAIVFHQFDLSELDETQQASKRQEIIEEQSNLTFDLTKDALVQLTAIKLSEQHHLLLLVLHHIVGDRESLQLLNQEWRKNYQALQSNQPLNEKPLPIQYADYAYWQRNQQLNKKTLDYWLNQLSGDLPILQLPTDKQRNQAPSFEGNMLTKKLAQSSYQSLKQLCSQHKTTLFVATLAAFKALLFRYSGQHDLLVGVPFSNRDKLELEQLIGFFNETLVMRTNLSDATTFKDLLLQVKQTTIDAFANKNIPFDTLVRRLNPDRIGTTNPIFQVMFVYNTKGAELDFGADLLVQERMLDLGVSKFDLTLFITDKGDHLAASLEYASDLFEAATIEKMLTHLDVLLANLVAQPDSAIASLNLLSEPERQQILIDWNATDFPAPEASSVVALFEAQAKQHPNQTAVVFQNDQLTYSELNQKANSLAQFLTQTQLPENCLIGLFVQPSIELLIGILGILKSGNAYLPLDPDYPSERIQYLLSDAKVKLVLASENLKTQLPKSECKVVCIQSTLNIFGKANAAFESTVTGEQLAYMIYTSGSTGNPKGVPITHSNLLHSTVARKQYYNHSPKAFLLLSSFAFDSSVAGIFWTISSGGKLVLTPKRTEQEVKQLSNLIENQGITHSLMLPSLYQTILEYASIQQLQSLATILVAGEACMPKLVKLHFDTLPQVLLYNEYGPTEGTVWSTVHQVNATDAQTSVPIGRPIPYAKNYILNSALQAVPIGVIGELMIGGKGIASGYWERPDLTKSKFIEHPFGEGKLYKTGDLAKYRPDGSIEFLGRSDHQVKIRGHRVELDEIKNELLRISAIEDAVVVFDAPQLIAYVISQDAIDTKAIQAYLRTQLPNYMVPKVFVSLSSFPKLPNGKINLKALPKAAPIAQATENNLPETELEKQLLTIWQQVLKLEQISTTDNFFEIGGDSISSIKVIAKAEQQGISVAPNLFFEFPDIKTLASQLSATKSDDKEWSSIAAINRKGGKTPLFCIHSGAAHVFFYRNLATYLGKDQPVYALQPKGLDGSVAKHNSIEEMATFYIQEIKRIHPNGPYSLLGTCFSNAVGLEMAHQLLASGERIEALIFVDSGPAHLSSAAIRGTNKTMSRFGNMLNQGDWKGISKKIRNRRIRFQRKLVHPFLNNQNQNLQDTIDNLNQLYKFYNWKPLNHKIIFIRSSEFANRPDKNYQVAQWQQLSKGNLEIQVVPGHHLTLFEEPEVQPLAVALKECLVVSQVDSVG